jgi:hypothetical protein
LRVGAAIVLDAFAFLVWDLATRSPKRLLGDVLAGLRHLSTAVRGLARFLTGACVLIAAASLLLALATNGRTFLVLETWTLVTGLLIEQLVGGEIAAGLRGARR